ncbi:hypothetical protein PG993_007895 [Apiospora rasikravindrae]|uniref:Uncharacterized protein n=1 Tax=Apiospora rasikravindrae TaxID=990691 RepID=A0ABR1T0M6_9PEZI
MDEEETDEDDYTPYAVNRSRAAYVAQFEQNNDLLWRRPSQVSPPANQLYQDQTSYEEFTDMDYLAPTPAEERHYSTSVISPKSVRFSPEVEYSGNNVSNTSSTPATSTRANSIQARRRSIVTRSTITTINNTESPLRIFYEIAAIVKKIYNWLVSLWNALVEEMGPLFVPAFTMTCSIAVLLFILAEDKSDPYGPIIWAFGVAFKNLGRQFIKGQRMGMLKQDIAFNMTNYFAGDGSGDEFGDERDPWRLYEQVLRDADGMETWFDEARAVDDVVSALWAGLPPLSGVVVPETKGDAQNDNSTGSRVVYQPQPLTVTVTFSGAEPESTRPWEKKEDNPWKKMDKAENSTEQDENTKAVMRRLRMRSAIDMRSTLRKRAEAYFENFLAGRVVTIGRVLDDARRFGELVETYVVRPNSNDDDDENPAEEVSNKIGPKFHADVAAKFEEESTSGSKILFWKKDKFAEVEVTNRTNYMLCYAGLHLMNRLVSAHTSLYASARPEPADLPADLRGQAASFFAPAEPDTLTALADLRRAEQAERAFLGDLIAQSAYKETLATPGQLPRDYYWAEEPATRALTTLVERMYRLERRLQSVSRRFAFMAERLAAQVANETGAAYAPDRSTGGGDSGMPVPVSEVDRPYLQYGVWRWGQAAEELVGSWGRAVEGG